MRGAEGRVRVELPVALGKSGEAVLDDHVDGQRTTQTRPLLFRRRGQPQLNTLSLQTRGDATLPSLGSPSGETGTRIQLRETGGTKHALAQEAAGRSTGLNLLRRAALAGIPFRRMGQTSQTQRETSKPRIWHWTPTPKSISARPSGNSTQVPQGRRPGF